MLSGEKVLITGPAGRIAFPLARSLAADNEVWGLARFSDPATRDKVDATRVFDIANGDYDELPSFDLPVTIARMCAAYGEQGGPAAWHLDAVAHGGPVRTRWDPMPYSPIHDDDIAAQLEALLDASQKSRSNA